MHSVHFINIYRMQLPFKLILAVKLGPTSDMPLELLTYFDGNCYGSDLNVFNKISYPFQGE